MKTPTVKWFFSKLLIIWSVNYCIACLVECPFWKPNYFFIKNFICCQITKTSIVHYAFQYFWKTWQNCDWFLISQFFVITSFNKIGVTRAILRSSGNIPIATDELKIFINGLIGRHKQVLITLKLIPS